MQGQVVLKSFVFIVESMFELVLVFSGAFFCISLLFTEIGTDFDL